MSGRYREPGRRYRGWDKSNLVTHWRHILSPDLSPLEFPNEQSDGVVFANDEHERVTYATGLDLWSRSGALQVLNNLPFGPVYAPLVSRHISLYGQCAYQARVP